jgi:hypothetical protein
MAHRPITTIEELITAAGESGREFVIALSGGLLSRKFISVLPPRNSGKSPRFYVVNMIDDSEQTLSVAGLSTKSQIGNAMAAGSFYLDEAA